MNKGEIISYISEDIGITKKDAEKFLNSFLSCLKKKLYNKKRVNLTGIGSFHFKDRDPRTGRNPKTGEKIEVPSKTVVKFTPSGKLKDAINKEEE